jgi:hypothetical protein
MSVKPVVRRVRTAAEILLWLIISFEPAAPFLRRPEL